MINGAHTIIYSQDAEADRAFFKDVLRLPDVDAGQGWLIFGLPPAELAVHPAESGGSHELYFMVEDIEVFVAQMKEHQRPCTEVEDAGWGLLTRLTLPGGGKIGVYQPRHPRPPQFEA